MSRVAKGKLRKLDRLHFLIHGLCYAEMARSRDPGALDASFARYLERENLCAARWRSQLAGFSDAEGLAIVPWPGDRGGPASAFNDLAVSILGDRCFILDCPDCLTPEFWRHTDQDFAQAVMAELQPAFVQQRLVCNKEEIVTDLHCLACCRRLEDLLRERRFALDRAAVSADGWGASFEGCVTKYTLTLRRMLRLLSPIEIDYGLTVPDTAFLVDIKECERFSLSGGLRLFLFRAEDRAIALYTLTSHSMADVPVFVRLSQDRGSITVRSKQGIRLWPQPETYLLAGAPLEYLEPAQQVVREEHGSLLVPVNAGFVYRLAKAPAYLFAPPEMPFERFRDVLPRAELVAV